jgi:hypothetical protein
MGRIGEDVEADLDILDVKIKQLKNEYQQYFAGNRPREPQLLRSEIQKMMAYYANVPVRNTAHRFRLNSLRARFLAFRRHWDTTVRKIEEGSYKQHLFKARLHSREREEAPKPPARSKDAGAGGDLFRDYVEARESCGQGSAGVTRQKLRDLISKQEEAIRARYGCEEVRFRVVVQNGRAKLKASPVRK